MELATPSLRARSLTEAARAKPGRRATFGRPASVSERARREGVGQSSYKLQFCQVCFFHHTVFHGAGQRGDRVGAAEGEQQTLESRDSVHFQLQQIC